MVKPETAFAMLASLAQHLKVLVAQIEQMKLLTTRQRTIRFLLDQSGQTDGAASFNLPHDKALIANRLGMKPKRSPGACRTYQARGSNDRITCGHC